MALRVSTLALIIVILVSATPDAGAQEQPPRLSEIIEVRLINVEVVVTDRDGNHVHGLTADDFEVYDAGRKQQITNFSEYASPERPTASSQAAEASEPPVGDLAPRHYVVFFDCLSSSTFDRQRVAPAIAEIIRQLRPMDDMMIVTWNRRLRIVAAPTGERDTLEKALSSSVRELSRWTPPQREIFPDLTLAGVPNPDVAGAEARLWSRTTGRQNRADLQNTGVAVNSMLAMLGGLDGRKVMILVSSAFGLDPAQFDDAAIPGEFAGELALIRSDPHGNPLAAITLAANAAGVSIYTMYAPGLAAPAQFSASNRIGEEQGRFSSDVGLSYLAAATGGLAATNTNSFKVAAARLLEDLSNYYAIGYRMPTAFDNRERKVEVRTRNTAYTVRHRGSAVQRTSEREVVDSVRSALMFPVASNALDITVDVGKPSRAGRRRLAIPIDVHIPMGSLSFTADFAGHAADLTIFIGSSDRSGSMSEVRRFHEVVRIRPEQLSNIRDRHYTYGMDVDLQTLSAENRLVVGVLDNVSKASGLASVEVKTDTPKRRR